MNMAVLEIRMQSGKEFHYLGENAERIHEMLAHGRSEIKTDWGLPPVAEVVIQHKYVECTTWYANGRP